MMHENKLGDNRAELLRCHCSTAQVSTYLIIATVLLRRDLLILQLCALCCHVGGGYM